MAMLAFKRKQVFPFKVYMRGGASFNPVPPAEVDVNADYRVDLKLLPQAVERALAAVTAV